VRARYTFVVLTQPVEGQDEEYNDWYTNQQVCMELFSPPVGVLGQPSLCLRGFWEDPG